MVNDLQYICSILNRNLHRGRDNWKASTGNFYGSAGSNDKIPSVMSEPCRGFINPSILTADEGEGAAIGHMLKEGKEIIPKMVEEVNNKLGSHPLIQTSKPTAVE
jgi:hypothetical protein